MDVAHDDVVGAVVEFYHERVICMGVVLGMKGQRVFVLSEHNREMNLSQSRLLQTRGPFLNPGGERDRLVARVREIGTVRKALAEEIDLQELWTLLEGEQEGYTLEDLAGFVFQSPDVDRVAALERSLLSDRVLFQQRDGLYYPRPREQVEQLKAQIEREAERERRLHEGSLWLKSLQHHKGTSPPSLPSFTDWQAEVVEKLKEFAIHGVDAEHYGFVKELFRRAELNTDPLVAFQLLVRAGIWEPDENLIIYALEIPRTFPSPVMAYARELVSTAGDDPLDTYREDLRHLWTISIDSEETRDIDDALSFEDLNTHLFRIGVHITDVAAYVRPGDPLDTEARARMTSIYLPDEKIPMIPTAISENLCSLVAHEEKRAISFLFTVDREGVVQGEVVVPSRIQVKERLTYDEANVRQERDRRLQELYEIACRLRDRRKQQGAMVVQLPEVYATVDEAGKVHLKRYEREEPSQITVSEWMIAANTLGAKFFLEKGIPAIYRKQGEMRQDNNNYEQAHPLFALLRQRRLFARAEISLQPDRHCNLGVACYASVTSPLRRYMDLILQRQMRSYFLGEGRCYDAEALDQIITEMNVVLPKVFSLSRRWNRYWVLRYIEQENIRETSALVLDQNDRYLFVVLLEFMIETSVPKKSGHPFSLGQMITVRIEKVKPREESLSLRLP